MLNSSRKYACRSLFRQANVSIKGLFYNGAAYRRGFSTGCCLRSDNKESPSARKPLDRLQLGDEINEPEPIRTRFFQFSRWKATIALLLLSGGTYAYLSRKRRLLETEKEADANRAYGSVALGGPFNLTDFNGKPFTEENLKGKFSILYFGFSHCPDICPEELDRLTYWISELDDKDHIKIQPLFISCDPARDTPDVLKEYLSDFHPAIIGLTGTYDQVKSVCKKYKVYFSTPRDVKPNQDYLVDHSIFFYLIDPEGQFIDALGRNYDEQSGLEKIREQIQAYVPKEERERRSKKWYSFIFN
ncbi:putative thioredoxin peroxidase SCO2 [Saccharomyces cerevisiae]|uniref:Sco2p n=1 Tax=Saccharomyces cerevisiae (strain CEN.PK113-7D) TaxID=889517 RepID=N1P882_YEASC